MQKVEGAYHYEERHLFSLIRLRNPRTRLIYITSGEPAPDDCGLLPAIAAGNSIFRARDRLLLFSAYDASAKPLTQKILERPRLMERICQAVRPTKSYMVCYNSTALERELSVKLGIPCGLAIPICYTGEQKAAAGKFLKNVACLILTVPSWFLMRKI